VPARLQFSPFSMRDVQLNGRIVVSPMGLYSTDGRCPPRARPRQARHAAGAWRPQRLDHRRVGRAEARFGSRWRPAAMGRVGFRSPGGLDESGIQCVVQASAYGARHVLFNPRWPWAAAVETGGKVFYPE